MEGPGEGAVSPRVSQEGDSHPTKALGSLGSPHPAPLSLFSALIGSEQGSGAEATLGDVVGGGPTCRGRASLRAWAVPWSWPRDSSGGPGFVLPPRTARSALRLLSVSG